eukprot:2079626-Rhodomonas_salina.1
MRGVEISYGAMRCAVLRWRIVPCNARSKTFGTETLVGMRCAVLAYGAGVADGMERRVLMRSSVGCGGSEAGVRGAQTEAGEKLQHWMALQERSV